MTRIYTTEQKKAILYNDERFDVRRCEHSKHYFIYQQTPSGKEKVLCSYEDASAAWAKAYDCYLAVIEDEKENGFHQARKGNKKCFTNTHLSKHSQDTSLKHQEEFTKSTPTQ